MPKRTAAVPLDVVEHDGYLYSTLDFVAPDRYFHSGHQGQNSFLRIREGWELVPAAQEVVALLKLYEWGTVRIVFENGDAHLTSSSLARWLAARDEDLKKGCLSCRGTSEYKPSKAAGDARVLIRRPMESPKAWGPAHCSQLMDNVWKKRRYTDFKIMCGDQEIECHRAILAGASSVFEAALANSQLAEAREQKMEIKDFEPAAVRAMVTFLYTGEVEDTSVDHVKLLALADCYGVESLVQAMAQHVLDKLCTDNVIPITRALRSFKDKPHVAMHWEQLQARLQQQPELLMTLMQNA
eukprot:TRINITY_DN27952_c0_g1_i1.p1 TRINITY_DN27952_c0_g1~~TRINITY_DN27952_c0_g1_i1.p1  ORF type:complete len:297 (+),score=65.66 TRINITY_DN27952_c0_g1_i1:44-934(+)